MTDTKQQEIEIYSTYDTVDEVALAERRVAIAKDYSIEPESIKFEIETEEDYGDTHAVLKAVFHIPKTKGDLAKEARQAEHRVELEREEYERLSKKFGPDYAAKCSENRE